jgi:hypothetical protein
MEFTTVEKFFVLMRWLWFTRAGKDCRTCLLVLVVLAIVIPQNLDFFGPHNPPIFVIYFLVVVITLIVVIASYFDNKEKRKNKF